MMASPGFAISNVVLFALCVICTGEDPNCRCVPSHGCDLRTIPWPVLNVSVGGRLLTNLKVPQQVNASLAFSDPLFLESQPGFSINSGYFGAWNTTSDNVLAYAVDAETSADLQATIRFAKRHDLRVGVKGTGHDSLGRWQLPGSLLIWTHHMTQTTWDPNLDICGERVHAVTADAGVNVWQLYNEGRAANRFFLAGDCTTVGHVGFATSGGYGYFSKYYGSAASNIVAAEIVTSNGDLVRATACEHADLLKAAKGGGGQSFGVIKSFTYRTYEMPKEFGVISLAKDSPTTSKHDNTTSLAIQEFLNAIRSKVMTKGFLQHIGGDFVIKAKGDVHIGMTYVGISESTCNSLFSDVHRYLKVQCKAAKDVFNLMGDPVATSSFGNRNNWFPSWESDLTSAFNIQMINRHIQESSMRDEVSVMRLADALQDVLLPLDPQPGVQEAIKITVSFQFAMGHGSVSAKERFAQTATNPAIGSAVAMIWLFWQVMPPHAEVAVHKHASEYSMLRTHNTFKFHQMFGPYAASYQNIGAYWETNWQQRFWGSNYGALMDTKRKYDPDALFMCHQCVGSEEWTEDGNCRTGARVI